MQDQQNRGGALTAADNTARVAISNCAFDANSADVSSPFAPPVNVYCITVHLKR